MGSIMTLYFLTKQSQAWKDKHIRSLISIAGVWGGTARAVKGSRHNMNITTSS